MNYLRYFTVKYYRCFFLIVFWNLLLSSCTDNTDTEPEILPEIFSISASEGSGEMWITIEGKNFGATPADNVVKFNGVEAKIYQVLFPTAIDPSPEKLIVEVPMNAGTGPVSVTVNDKTVVGPVFTYIVPQNVVYYIRFKYNGILKEFTKSESIYAHCGMCSCAFMELANSDNASLSVCRPETVTSAMILDLKGKTLPMRDNAGFPYARFTYGYSMNQHYYNSGTLDNLNSTVTINEVKYHSSYHGSNAYNVSGTFEGVLWDPDQLETAIITEGEFLIRFTSSKEGA